MTYYNPHKRKATKLILDRVIHNASRYYHDLTVLCMPGKVGYEIDYFKRWESVKLIIAIERDEIVYNDLVKRYKDLIDKGLLRLFKGEVKTFLFKNKIKFDLIYLDYYSNFSASVQNDLKIIIAKKMLTIRGKLVVNTYGSREDLETQFENKLNIKWLEGKLKKKVDLQSESLRGIYFNAFIAKICFDLHQKYRVPSCHTYETKSHKMYTFWTSYLGDTGKDASIISTIGGSVDRWLYIDRPIVHIETSQIFVQKTDKDYFLKEAIMKFYNEHHFVPTVRELKLDNIKSNLHYAKRIKELGLCPNSYATKEDIEKELNRIILREGTLSVKLLIKARLSRRKELKNIDWKKYGLSMGLVDNYNKDQMIIQKRRLDRLNQYVLFLDTYGQRQKTKFKYYTWLKKNSLSDYFIAKKEIIRLTDNIKIL